LPVFALAVAALSLAYFTLGFSASLRKSQTGDEGVHLTGGVTYWALDDYRIQPENGNWPQRLCGLPVWLSGYRLPSMDSEAWRKLDQWGFAEEFFYQCGNDPDQMLLRGRAMTALVAVALGWLVCGWSRRLFGPAAGLLSLALFAFSPTTLTHGFLVTSDIASALFFTASVGALWRLLHRVSPLNLVLTWFALSGLFLSKFSAPMIVPIGVLMLAVRLCNRQPTQIVGFSRSYDLQGASRILLLWAVLIPVLMLGVALSIWASFGFRYSMLNPDLGAPTSPIDWSAVSTTSQIAQAVIDKGRSTGVLPEGYLFGFSHVMHYSEMRSAFLNGEYRRMGWLSFFPYCFVYKTPLSMFAILALAAAALWRYRPRRFEADASAIAEAGFCSSKLYDLTPFAALIVVYWVFALSTHLNIGHRHLLPTYPALFIVAGAAVWWIRAPFAQSRAVKLERRAPPVPENPALIRSLRWLFVAALLWSLADGVWIWPHYLAYFNPLAGGPSNGYRHLVDSSLDWSQDLKETKAWLDAHPEDARDPGRLYFAFYGVPPLSFYGIQSQHLPSFPLKWEPHVPQPLTGGTYLVSATMLPGVVNLLPGRWNATYESQYRNLSHSADVYRQLSPTAEGRKEMSTFAPESEWQDMLKMYESARFMRLASFLRRREPDDEIGYSILVYRLTDDEVARALTGPPVELLPEPEWKTENRWLGYEAGDSPSG
jgi:hypothetical protein